MAEAMAEATAETVHSAASRADKSQWKTKLPCLHDSAPNMTSIRSPCQRTHFQGDCRLRCCSTDPRCLLLARNPGETRSRDHHNCSTST